MAEERLHAAQRRFATNTEGWCQQASTQAANVVLKHVRAEWRSCPSRRALDAAPPGIKALFHKASGKKRRARPTAGLEARPTRRGNPRNIYISLKAKALQRRGGIRQQRAKQQAALQWHRAPSACRACIPHLRQQAMRDEEGNFQGNPAAAPDSESFMGGLGSETWPVSEVSLQRFLRRCRLAPKHRGGPNTELRVGCLGLHSPM